MRIKPNEIGELDEIAERAGGYVMPPWDVKTNDVSETKFADLRRISREKSISTSSLLVGNLKLFIQGNSGQEKG